MFGYDSLNNWYKVNFSLMQHHKYSLVEIEGMIPWEKTLYIQLLHQHIKHLEDVRKQQENDIKAHMKRAR